MQEESRNFSAA